MPTYNVSKKRGKSKIKISDKREAAMNKIMGLLTFKWVKNSVYPTLTAL